MKNHAFLSYSSKMEESANILIEYLRCSGLTVFWDKDISPGDEHRKVLEKELKESKSILVLIGPDGAGPWQQVEIDFIFSETKKRNSPTNQRIIPLIISGGSLEHHDVPAYLRTYQSLKLGTPIDSDLENLQKLISTISFGVPTLDGLERPISNEDVNSLILDSVSFYDEHAEQFYEKYRQNLPGTAIESFLGYLSHKQTILDAGCGPGHHSLHFMSQGFDVRGIDLSSGALKIANDHNSSVPFTRMDMRNMSFENNSFDAIWAAASCVHIPREQMVQLLFEYLRVIRPSGVLGLSVHLEKPVEKKADGRFFESYRGIDELEDLLEYVGYEILDDNEEIKRESTFETRRVKKWGAIRARAPKDKKVLNEKVFANKRFKRTR